MGGSNTVRKLWEIARRIAPRLTDYLRYSPAERRHAHVGPPKLWKMKRDFQIRFLTQVGLEARHHLLDLGCGSLRGGICLIAYLDTGHYCGVEARQYVLDEGRKELAESNLIDKNPTLLVVEDLAVLKLDKKFDYIWAFSVLIHMEDKILYNSLGFVRDHLSSEGRFYANVNIDDGEDGCWQGFPVVRRSLPFYEEACSRSGLRVEDLGPLTDFGHDLPGKTFQEQASQRMFKIWKA